LRFPLAEDSWGPEEQSAIQRVIASNRYSMGNEVFAFESKICQMFGSKHAVMVNSGSSANLVMLTALKIMRGENWPEAPEVIVPALSWSTTFTPFYYLGLTPVFVDIKMNSLCVDPDKVRKAITKNTVAILTVNILGQSSDLQELFKIAEEFGIDLLEDNCESLGATLDGKYTGGYGLASSQSSFYSHHISTMEGGWIQTNDKLFADICKSLRAHGWIRELDDSSSIAERTGIEFRDKFNFILPGLNFRPLEFEGAIGIAQLEKLSHMLSVRRQNAQYFQGILQDIEDIGIQSGVGESSWFAFAILVKGKLIGLRDELALHLQRNGVECRPIIAGNFTKQPVMKYLNGRIPFSLEICDWVHENGLYIGNHPHDLTRELKIVHEIIIEFIEKH